MPAHSLGDQRFVQTGVNSAGDPVYERNLGAGVLDHQEPEATDAAEKLAAELGVDLASVEGTGKGGNITVADVKAAASD